MPAASNTQSNYSVLLPKAKVLVFAKDKKLIEYCNNVTQDWRFVRVVMEGLEGDIDSAIEHISNKRPPALIIIEAQNVDDAFIEKLDTLAENCDEDTSAAIIGPTNDIELYRRLIDLGVSEYLVRPVEETVFRNTVAGILIEQLGVSESRLVTFLSSKGGTGSTTIAQNIAMMISEQTRQKSIIADLSGGRSYLSIALTGDEPTGNLEEAVQAACYDDEDALSRMITEVSKNLSMLSIGTEDILKHGPDIEEFERLIDGLMTKYPLVIVDVGTADPGIARMLVSKSKHVLIVASPELPSMRAARSLLQEVSVIRGNEDKGVEYIINKKGNLPGKEIGEADIETSMEKKPLTVIPYDAKLFLTLESENKKLAEEKSAKRVIKSLEPILQKLQREKGKNTEDNDKISKDKKSKGLFSFMGK